MKEQWKHGKILKLEGSTPKGAEPLFLKRCYEQGVAPEGIATLRTCFGTSHFFSLDPMLVPPMAWNSDSPVYEERTFDLP